MTAEDAPPRHAVTQVLTSTDAAGHAAATEVIVEEAVAIVFNGTTAAVMMATPGDVADLAHGFALTEGYIAGAGDIESYEEVRHDEGVEARFWVGPERANALEARRRSMAGPVGCGLCGIDSLQQVRRPLGAVNARLTLTPEQITGAMAALSGWQPLKQRTRSTHAAAFFVPGQGITLAREDVGRHNALDKLIGAMMAGDVDAGAGAVVVTSRVSVELVQKCAVVGCGTLIAASGPTTLAIETADATGLRLIGFCRGESYRTFADGQSKSGKS